MRFFLFFTLILLPIFCFSQRTLTISEILGTVKSQPQFQLQERKLNFLKQTKHDLPIINRWEFRTQTHDLDLSEQRFTFRVRPNSRKERLVQQQSHLSTIQFYQEQTRQVLLEGIQKRYNTCLNLMLAKSRKRLLSQLEEVYKDLAIAYEKDLNFDNLIEAEENAEEFSLKLFDYQRNIERAFRKVNHYTNDKSDFIIEDVKFISISLLKERILAIDPSEQFNSPSLALLENEINLVEKELLVEKAKQSKWLSFAQFRYGGSDPYTPFRETFNLAVAFQIPVKGNSILKMNKLQLERIAAENSWGEESYFIEKERKNLLRELSNLLEKYEQLSKNLIAAQEKVTRSFNVNNTENYTIISLKMRAYVLKKKLRLNLIEEKIYQSYLDWLAVTGKMIEVPLVNYLSTDLQNF